MRSRVSDEQRATRLLRLRADARLASALKPGINTEAARLCVPSREPVEVGEAVNVEVSFGPMADEVLLDGVVRSLVPGEGSAPPAVEIAIGHQGAERIRYIRDVLAGSREAHARSHRRVEVDLVGRWSSGRRRYPARVLDLSPGGAFVTSRELPPLGADVTLEIRPTEGPAVLQVDGVTSWLRTEGTLGFGIQFRIRDRDLAAGIRDLLRVHEADPLMLVARQRH